ncbi:MAG: hypothetical protein ACYDG2_24840 [Ruminiclostridium sp.]
MGFVDLVCLILLALFIGFIGAAILLTIYDSYAKKENPEKFANKDNDSHRPSKRMIALTLIIASLYIGYYTMKNYWGTTTIGSFFEKNYYTTQYYVNLFPDKNNAKNYRVKADIISDIIEWDGTDNEENSFTNSKRVYWLKKVYFNNSGYITFDKVIENADDDSGLEVDEKVHLIDDKGEEWWAELTKEKVN